MRAAVQGWVIPHILSFLWIQSVGCKLSPPLHYNTGVLGMDSDRRWAKNDNKNKILYLNKGIGLRIFDIARATNLKCNKNRLVWSRWNSVKMDLKITGHLGRECWFPFGQRLSLNYLYEWIYFSAKHNNQVQQFHFLYPTNKPKSWTLWAVPKKQGPARARSVAARRVEDPKGLGYTWEPYWSDQARISGGPRINQLSNGFWEGLVRVISSYLALLLPQALENYTPIF